MRISEEDPEISFKTFIKVKIFLLFILNKKLNIDIKFIQPK